jgi:hypothetical protein
MRAGVMGAFLVFCVAGCGSPPAPPDPRPAEPASLVEITIHVPDMTKVLQIT